MASVAAMARNVACVETFKPKHLAVSAIGEGCSVRPRPAGRGGWVYTAVTLCPAATMARKVGTANAGVPMKTRRSANHASTFLVALVLSPLLAALVNFLMTRSRLSLDR